MKRHNIICILIILLNHASHSPLAESSQPKTDDLSNTTLDVQSQVDKSSMDQVQPSSSETNPIDTENKFPQENSVDSNTLITPKKTDSVVPTSGPKSAKSFLLKDKIEDEYSPTTTEPVKVVSPDSDGLLEQPEVAVEEKIVLTKQDDRLEETVDDTVVLNDSKSTTKESNKEDDKRNIKEESSNEVDDSSKEINSTAAENAQVKEELVVGEKVENKQESKEEENAEVVVPENDGKQDQVSEKKENEVTENRDSENPSEEKESVGSEADGSARLNANMTESNAEAVGDGKTIDEGTKEGETADDKQEHVKLEVDSIQSFEEWKKKQIQDREEAAAVDINVSSQRKIRTKKTQVNYASQDCGAKILAHNPESKHTSAILDENKDMYMLNPCSANIWFVVEMCEPIQVRQLQLANLELFSSAPKLFGVYVSERYPAREWHQLGNFEARNERSVQTFPFNHQNDLMFAKYIKFEMKSHFGNEHFCPLTLVRVLGVSMVEEYEETEEKENKKSVPVDEDTVPISEMRDENVAVPQGQVDEDGVSIGKVLNIMKSAVGNLLGNGVESDSSDNSSSSNQTESKDTVNKTHEDDSFDPNWESQVTLVTNKSEVERPKAGSDRPLVTLVQTGDGQEIVYLGASSVNPPPIVDLAFLSKLSHHRFSAHLCWFLEFVYRVSILSCIVQPHNNQTSVSHAFVETVRKPIINATTNNGELKVPQQKDELSATSGELDHVTIDPGETKSESNDGVDASAVAGEDKSPGEDSKANKTDRKPLGDDSGTEEPVAKQPEPKLAPVAIPDELKGETSKDQQKCQISDEVKSNRDTSSSKAPNDDVIPDKPRDNHDDSKTTQNDDTVSTGDDSSPDNTQNTVTSSHDVKIPPTENEQTDDIPAIGKDTDTANADNGQMVEESAEKPEENVKDEVGSREKMDENAETEADFVLPAPTTTPSPLTPQEEPGTAIPPLTGNESANSEQQLNAIVEDQVVINPGTNQKESVLMRLSNRIRALEQNMSLSSDYLEDLSQRYRRQMDEMQKAFNRTKTKLAEAARRAEESEHKQTEAIHLAHNKTALLQDQVSDMSDGFEYLNRQMVARHLCLMALESVVLIIITVTCFGARQIRLAKRVERAEKLVLQLYQQHPQLPNGDVPTDDKAGIKKRKIAVKHAPKTNVESLHRSSPSRNGKVRNFSRPPLSLGEGCPEPTPLRRKSLKSTLSVQKKHRGGGQITKSRKMKMNGAPSKSASSAAGAGCANGANGFHGNRRGSSSGLLTSDILRPPQQPPASKGPKTGPKVETKKVVAPPHVLGTVAFTREIPPTVGCRNHVPWASPTGVLSGKAR